MSIEKIYKEIETLLRANEKYSFGVGAKILTKLHRLEKEAQKEVLEKIIKDLNIEDLDIPHYINCLKEELEKKV